MKTRSVVTWRHENSTITLGCGPFASYESASRVFEKLHATPGVDAETILIVEVSPMRDVSFFYDWNQAP